MKKIARKKIDDFGEFIPNCPKYQGASSYEEYAKMKEAELRIKAKREVVWPVIDAVKLVEGGEDNFLVYMKTRIRRLTLATPSVHNNDFMERAKEYVKALLEVREAVMKISDESELFDFLHGIKHKIEWRCCLNYYRIYSFSYNLASLKERCKQLNFPYTDKKKCEERKKSFKLAPLENIEREGVDYRKGKNSTERKWKNAFKFRGVVFGASVPQKERQDDLNFGYDGLMDMAVALGIENSDLSFGGKLNISFAARGRGYASGHYETLYEVINMTRLRGAGTFAKLWFHALDDAIAKHCGITSGHLASNADEDEREKLPASFLSLMSMFHTDDEETPTAFALGSGTFGRHFKRGAYGNWNSTSEMMARAFACYLKDCIGCKSDYIVAHADSYHWNYENEKVVAIPQGEERKLFNRQFEKLIIELKDMGFFHQRTEKAKPKKDNPKIISMPDDIDVEGAEQMSFI